MAGSAVEQLFVCNRLFELQLTWLLFTDSAQAASCRSNSCRQGERDTKLCAPIGFGFEVIGDLGRFG